MSDEVLNSELVRIWDNVVFVDEFRVSDSRKVTVELATREGKTFVHLREWYFVQRDLIWRPQTNGIILPAIMPKLVNGKARKMDCLARVINSLAKAREIAPTVAIEDKDNEVVMAKVKTIWKGDEE